MACFPRKGKLTCQGRKVLSACRERKVGFITGVPVRKGRKTACLLRKEGRERKEERRRACQGIEEENSVLTQTRETGMPGEGE
jgi:hypothetical protein